MKTDESADKQVAEKLVEALVKIGATMTAISKAQAENCGAVEGDPCGAARAARR